ncbi:MAG: diguanylate cyclase [Desulfarculus sp.]|nr:diguanylate cyclase [Desulfarculus sp.]
MVEVSDDPVRLEGDAALREKVGRLTKELDRLENRNQKVCAAFRGALTAVAGLGAGPHVKAVDKALKEMKKVAAAKSVDPQALDTVVDHLKTALMAAPEDRDQSVSVREEDERPALAAPGEQASQPDSGATAAGHVALALLEGLRLGQPEFDAHLEKAIVQLNAFIQSGQVRPAMALLVDLLAHYRQVHTQERLAAELALKEVLKEVFNTENELADLFQQTQRQISQAGQTYEDKMTSQMGRLVQEVVDAKDLNTLKSSALEHIRAMRDHIRAQRAQEKEMLARTQGELAKVCESLDCARQRMEQVEQISQRLSQEALTDPLTKSWNKRALTARLASLLKEGTGGGHALIVFDIDKFKAINDNFGHQAGDRALQAIAQQAAASLRQHDVLYRYAGDEFVILLENTPLADAVAVAERVRQAALNIRFTYRGSQELHITVSLGVAPSRPNDTPETLFERADKALYAAKNQGRNRVVQG